MIAYLAGRGYNVSSSQKMSDLPSRPNTDSTLFRLVDSDRVRLGEAFRMLLDRGSILGSHGPHTDLYLWCTQTKPWLEEMAALFDLQLFWEDESRLVQAVPRSSAFLMRLRLDATLVLLTLWYEFDTAVRDRGESPPVILNAEQLNADLETKFSALRNVKPSQTRLVEILRLAQRKNLVRFTPSAEPAQTRIEILATIRKIIPFQSMDDWTHHADRFLPGGKDEQSEPLQNDDDAQD
jgi:hypothetical protein